MNEMDGIDMQDTADMMRLDSMIMAVQVSVRFQLDQAGARNVKIIAEKVRALHFALMDLARKPEETRWASGFTSAPRDLHAGWLGRHDEV